VSLHITQRHGSARFAVHVQPRASRAGIGGLHGEALKVRVAAPPVDDAANDEVVEMIAAALGIARRSVRVVAGRASRGKIVEVVGVDVDNIRRLAYQTR
jgi:uncharacterized protein (TIGR00251 family)